MAINAEEFIKQVRIGKKHHVSKLLACLESQDFLVLVDVGRCTKILHGTSLDLQAEEMPNYCSLLLENALILLKELDVLKKLVKEYKYTLRELLDKEDTLGLKVPLFGKMVPLGLTVVTNNLEACRFLVEHGAHKTGILKEHHIFRIVKLAMMLNRQKIFEVLVETVAPNLIDAVFGGTSLLQFASTSFEFQSGNLFYVEILLRQGANINLTTPGYERILDIFLANLRISGLTLEVCCPLILKLLSLADKHASDLDHRVDYYYNKSQHESFENTLDVFLQDFLGFEQEQIGYVLMEEVKARMKMQIVWEVYVEEESFLGFMPLEMLNLTHSLIYEK
jgi:hypothetical protein